MPKTLQYTSFNLNSGIATGDDSDKFENLKLVEVENLEYDKSDSLTAIKSYTKIANSPERFIEKIRFRNTFLAFTHNKVYKFDNEDNSFQKLGNYLNASNRTYVIKQEDKDIFEPAIDVKDGIIYSIYRNELGLFYSEYDTQSRAPRQERTIALFSAESDISNLSIKFISGIPIISYSDGNTLVVQVLEGGGRKYLVRETAKITGIEIKVTGLITASVVYALGSARKRISFDVHQLDTTLPTAETTTETASFDRRTNNNMIESPAIGSKTYFNMRRWAEFTHDNINYVVLWSKRDGYFVVDDEGELVARFGNSASPSFNDNFFMDQNVIVDGDDIFIPILLSTKTSLKERGDSVGETLSDPISVNSEIFYPLGFQVIHLKVSKTKPEFDTTELSNGILIASPCIKYFDGSTLTEFNFADKIDELTIMTPSDGITPFLDSTINLNYNATRADDYTGASNVRSAFEYNPSNTQTPVGTWTFRRRTDTSRAYYRLSSGPSFLGSSIADSLPFSFGYIENDLRIDRGRVEITTQGRGSDSRGSIESQARVAGLKRYDSSRARYRDREYEDVDDGRVDFRTSSGGVWNKVLFVYNADDKLIGVYGIDTLAGRDGDGDYWTYEFRDIRIPSLNLDNRSLSRAGSLSNTMTIRLYDLETIGIGASEIENGGDATVFGDLFSSQNSIGPTALTFKGNPSEYTLRAEIKGATIEVSISGTTTPPKADDFESLFVRKRGDVSGNTFTFSQGTTSVDNITRKWIIGRNDFEFDSNSVYEITARNQLGALWESEAISVTDFTIGENDFRIEEVSVTDDTHSVSLVLNKQASLIKDGLTVSLVGTSTTKFGVKSVSGNTITYSRDSSGTPITSLSGSTKSKATLRLRIIEPIPGAVDLSSQPLTSYQYQAYWKWIDASGKEHISKPSYEYVFAINGKIGETYGQAPNQVTLAPCIRLANPNLTTKKNVSVTLLRATLTGRNVSATYEIVFNDVPINVNAEYTDLVDNKRDSDLIGAVGFDQYADIIQPSGANSVATDRLGRSFLGNIIGYENFIAYSNQASNLPSEIFRFTDNTLGNHSSIILDNPILKLVNLDNNIVIFSERESFLIRAESLFVNRIQGSQGNYATQKNGIVGYENGIFFINEKGLFLLERGFTTKWASKEISDILASSNIISAKSSILSNEVRFILDDGRVLKWHIFYKKWTTEATETSSEVEIGDVRYKSDFQNRVLRTTDEDKEMSFIIETGWINIGAQSKATLLRSILLLGRFNVFKDFVVKIGYNRRDYFDEVKRPTPPNPAGRGSIPASTSPVKDRGIQNTIKLSTKHQKISSFKVRAVVLSKSVKLSSLGIEVRKQTGGEKVSQKQSF